MRGCGQSRADGGTVAIRDARDDVKRRIIISSSDAQFLLFARHVFAREGFDTVLSVDCETALSLCRVQPPAALLTDCGASGAVALCEAVKANTMTQQTLFVALVEPGQDDDVLAYVNAGADAVFVKPVDPQRIVEVFGSPRRTRHEDKVAPPVSDTVLEHDDIVLDLGGRRCFRDGLEVQLPLLEFNLLACLMRQPFHVFGRQELIAAAWPKGIFVDRRTVNVHIGRLRRALMSRADNDPVRTVRGLGYSLRPRQPQQGR